MKSAKYGILALAALVVGMFLLAAPVNAAYLNNWDYVTAEVILSSSDISNSKADGIFGPGARTYYLVDSQINTVKILRSAPIMADLRAKGLTPETYFETKSSIVFQPLFQRTKTYRERLAWDVWVHAWVANMRVCFPVFGCIGPDPSPKTVGFNRWFISNALGEVD